MPYNITYKSNTPPLGVKYFQHLGTPDVSGPGSYLTPQRHGLVVLHIDLFMLSEDHDNFAALSVLQQRSAA